MSQIEWLLYKDEVILSLLGEYFIGRGIMFSNPKSFEGGTNVSKKGSVTP